MLEPTYDDIWGYSQKRTGMRDFVHLTEMDEQQQKMVDGWINGPKVEMFYDLNDETDYAVPYFDMDGKAQVARISECVTINGVRWHLQPGKNVVPKEIYEFLLQCPDQRRLMRPPEPNKANHLGKFISSV